MCARNRQKNPWIPLRSLRATSRGGVSELWADGILGSIRVWSKTVPSGGRISSSLWVGRSSFPRRGPTDSETPAKWRNIVADRARFPTRWVQSPLTNFNVCRRGLWPRRLRIGIWQFRRHRASLLLNEPIQRALDCREYRAISVRTTRQIG